MEGIARSRAGAWLAINVANPLDRRLLRLTKGRISSFAGQQVGLLETVGCRSGERRATPLLYLRDGERVVLVASKGGNPHHPGWYHNLRADPEVGFMGRDGKRRRYRAQVATGEEREVLWRRVNDLYAGYDDYAERTGGRTIPVVVLEPLEGPAGAAGPPPA
jgi:deazaflavin-dependent oxidoreductase (nitroreductase family)